MSTKLEVLTASNLYENISLNEQCICKWTAGRAARPNNELINSQGDPKDDPKCQIYIWETHLHVLANLDDFPLAKTSKIGWEKSV